VVPVIDVAVTGPTGTLGASVVPRLLGDPLVGRVVGIARRPFDPVARGWDGLHYRQGDVRDTDGLTEAFDGADVVVHLAFIVTGAGNRDTIREVNVDGTLSAFRAAVAAGARRFVYTSSLAAYGFHADNPVGMTEDWPVRPARRFFYAQEKAELELTLADEAAGHPDIELYVLRPCIVLGPDAVGAKTVMPEPLMGLLERLGAAAVPPPVPLPVPVPKLPLQFVHQDDVADAVVRCVVAAGPPGAYNLAGDGIVTADEIVAALGFTPVPLPAGPLQRVAGVLAGVPTPPLVPPAVEWIEAISHPAIMDTTAARERLGWAPRYSGIEALRDTVRTWTDR
jgi:nucleoside-diphosphate-sugar epimerase